MAKNPLGDRSTVISEEPEVDERIVRRPAGSEAQEPRYADPTRSPPEDGSYVSRMANAPERGNGSGASGYSSKDSRGESDTGPMRGDITAMSEDEIDEFLRNQFTSQVLPDCPIIPGYHTCWLSTTNQYDTIQFRMRLGYTPVTTDDVPVLRSTTLKTGEYTGMIGVNEMLLFKVPTSIYQKLMKHYHHDRPNDEEERLRAHLDLMQSGELSKGRTMVAEIGDGTEEMLRRNPARQPGRFE